MARMTLTGATALCGALLLLRPAPLLAAGLDMIETYAGALGLAEEAPMMAAAALPEAELDAMRGGFALPGGLEVAFGFDITTRLGGTVVQRLSMPVTQIGGAPLVVQVNDDGSLRMADAAGGPVVVDRSFNGGATRIVTALDGGFVGLVQNSASGQHIDRQASFQVDIAGMRRMLDGAATRRMMDGALARGTGRRL